LRSSTSRAWRGIEARAPFLEGEYAAFGQDRSALGKRELRAAFANDLPREVLRLPKTGFALPLDRWFRGDLPGSICSPNRARGSANTCAQAALPRWSTGIAAATPISATASICWSRTNCSCAPPNAEDSPRGTDRRWAFCVDCPPFRDPQPIAEATKHMNKILSLALTAMLCAPAFAQKMGMSNDSAPTPSRP